MAAETFDPKTIYSQDKQPRLIVNSPYEEPKCYWKHDTTNNIFTKEEGRRPAGYFISPKNATITNDPGRFVKLELAEKIRKRVKAWREDDYPGVTSVTRRLLKYWYDEEEFGQRRFFFCQLEAAETLIWLTEATSDQTGIEVPKDGNLVRQCAKMATGSGKTLVMGMIIAWQILNKVYNSQDSRFSKNVLIIAPGLTVKRRLKVLKPGEPGNYYEEFCIVPPGPEFFGRLSEGEVQVHNWHRLNWETEKQIKKKRGVDKRGPKSDTAYLRELLGDMEKARNIMVINDEAHHAWRIPQELVSRGRPRGVDKEQADAATKWIGGLDRINRARGISICYDFSATPMPPQGASRDEERLFDWIVSDFGLNDAIEAGLVKTPRVVVRDDAKPDENTDRSRFYHIYGNEEVKDDLNRKAKPDEPLPDLVRQAYHFLGYDWAETDKAWQALKKWKGKFVPPVMITIANRTETAARVKHTIDKGRIDIDGFCEPDCTLRIDSKVLKQAEAAEETASQGADGQPRPSNARTRAEDLRKMVDTVGQHGEAGAHLHHVISVGMLSEGWDAKTVTHIMGLRAFSSQLLCEQVVGRGLRRTNYEPDAKTGLFDSEYVNVFGVPFTFLPFENHDEDWDEPDLRPRTLIEPDPDKVQYELSWPNVIRVDRVLKPRLSLDWSKVETLVLNSEDTPSETDLAPILDGEAQTTSTTIDLRERAKSWRTQTIIFQVASYLFDEIRGEWRGAKALLIAELIRLTEEFVASDKIVITPPLFGKERKLVINLNMTKVVRHLKHAIRFHGAEKLEPVFDNHRPTTSTGDMRRWYTSKPCKYTERSHINFCVFDSGWEETEAAIIDNHPKVKAWVKNDHLGFEVYYIFRGVVRKYRPDFIIKGKSGKMLVLEVKGQDSPKVQKKKEAMEEWVAGVNAHGGFGQWAYAISWQPGQVAGIIEKLL